MGEEPAGRGGLSRVRRTASLQTEGNAVCWGQRGGDEVEDRKTEGRLRRHAAAVFALVLLAALLLTSYMEWTGILQERDRMSHIAQSVGSETYETLLSEMGKTRVLEAYLIQTGGSYEGFEEVAPILLREKFVRNVLFAPGGVVEAVYPLAGNESAVGLDMNREGAGNLEAQAAMEKGELYIAGPFALIQGGMGIAGRLPVYLEEGAGQRSFWGIVSVTLDFPEVLSGSPVERAGDQGFACEVWRVNPDTGERQTILTSDTPPRPGWQSVAYRQELFNAVWTVTLSPLRPWYARPSLWLYLAVGLLLSLLAAVVTYNLERVRLMRAEAARRAILQLKTQLEHEQTDMLLSQIRSHFFYHTLNALQALIVLRPEEAYKMAGDFARYLRFSLDAATAAGGMGTFREELRAVRAYADINQAQLGDRLTMVYHVPPEADFPLPVLTIQPVVENAILHGIRPKVGGGTVTVSLEEGEDGWRVTVADAGLGFDPAAAAEEGSIGLDNVRRRLRRFPGCGIEIRSAPGRGTRVVMTYPKGAGEILTDSIQTPQ